MRVPSLLFLTLTSAAVIANGEQLQLNGWFPCGVSTIGAGEPKASGPFECAEVDVPLCYEGICESEKTISIFVRRLLANTTETSYDRPRSLWMLQGGPGYSSSAMEMHMLTIYGLLGGEVSFYTMDHRGTGRSSFLECKASQAFAQGGPGGVDMGPDEIPNCIKDVLFQIDNQTAAFSVTSAAKDMTYLVQEINGDDEDVFIYGCSYGTYFTERIMHLAPPNVKGYILDGVVPEDNPSFTTTNPDRTPPGQALTAACEEDELCSSKFEAELTNYDGLWDAWLAQYDTLDNYSIGENACADMFLETQTKPSDGIRSGLANVVGDVSNRVVVPAVFYRLNRCSDDDVTFLRLVFNLPAPVETSSGSSSTSEVEEVTADPSLDITTDSEPAAYNVIEETSPLLAGIIKASEMWTVPSPSWADEMDRYKEGIFTVDMSTDYLYYCFLTNAFEDPACTNILELLNGTDVNTLKAGPFVYEPDEYWHTFVTVPEGASAMIINGKMDFATVSTGGEREYENIEGEKIMINFDYGTHCTGISPTTGDDTTQCGYRIIASFVAVGGSVVDVDTSCLDELPGVDFNASAAYQMIIPGLTDLFDGSMSEYFQKVSETATTTKKQKKEKKSGHLHHHHHKRSQD